MRDRPFYVYRGGEGGCLNVKHVLQLSAKVDLRLRLELNSSGGGAELTLVKTERKSNSANRFFGNI